MGAMSILGRIFRRQKREIQTSENKESKPSKARGRPKGRPTEKLTLRIPTGLKEPYKKYCDRRGMTVSEALGIHISHDLDMEKISKRLKKRSRRSKGSNQSLPIPIT